MQYTMFDTPVLRPFLHWFSLFFLNVSGWKKEGQVPDIPKFVMIAAPHTSNWDLFYTLMLAFAFRIKAFWMGKNSIFSPPFGNLCRWLGGISIDRSQSNNMVSRTIDVFNAQERLVMIIPPEGTRKKVPYWKTGFYYIAWGARVPIVLGYVDYRRKAGGIGPAFMPTGDVEADMAIIKNFYATIIGKRPDEWSHEAIAVRK